MSVYIRKLAAKALWGRLAGWEVASVEKWWKDMCLLLPSFFLAVAVVVSVLGVSPKTAETTDNIRSGTAGLEQEKPPEGTKPEGTVYKDGIYKGTGQGFGGPVKVEVTVQEGKIMNIDILSHKKEARRFFKRARKVTKEILEQQNADVDAVSGATYSSYGIIDAVGQALGQAAGNDTGSQGYGKQDQAAGVMEEVADGTFQGSAECRVFKYTVQLKVTFEDGYITKIHHLKVKNNKNPANQDFWKPAYRTLKKDIIKEQDAQVDAVSGATFVSDAMKDAYQDAYQKAVEAKEKEK